MKKYLRWQGLVTFVTILGLLAAIIYIFAGQLIKYSVEKGGSYYLGAEVNLAKASVNWSPISVTLNQLQVTDANAPDNNLVQFEKTEMSIDLWQYLMGRTIIDNLEMTKLAFNKPRLTTGKVYNQANDISNDKSGLDSSKDEKSLKLPSAQDIIERENLTTPAKVEQLKVTYAAEKAKLESLENTLPDKQKLKLYEQKIKEITSVKIKSPNDLVNLKQQLDDLKADINKDKAVIKNAKNDLKASKDKLSTAISELKAAPSQDWQTVKNKYQLDSFEAEDVAHMLFGESGREYYGYAERIYQQLKPLIGNSAKDANEPVQDQNIEAAERFVHFSEDNPMPDWLVKKGQVSLVTRQGEIVAQIEELNMQHWLRDKPTQINLQSAHQTKMNLLGQLSFYQSKGQQFKSQGDWKVSNIKVNTDKPTENKKFNITQADIQSDGQYSLNTNQIEAKINLNLINAQFATQSSSELQKSIVDGLNQKSNIPATILLTGSVLNPNWAIKTDVTNIVKDVAKAKVDDKLTQLKTDLNTRLNDKVKAGLAISDNAEFVSIDGLINDTEGTLDNLLDDIVEKQKAKLEDKVKDKLKDKLKSLF